MPSLAPNFHFKNLVVILNVGKDGDGERIFAYIACRSVFLNGEFGERETIQL